MFKREKDEFRFEPMKIQTLVRHRGGNFQQAGGKANWSQKSCQGWTGGCRNARIKARSLSVPGKHGEERMEKRSREDS